MFDGSLPPKTLRPNGDFLYLPINVTNQPICAAPASDKPYIEDSYASISTLTEGALWTLYPSLKSTGRAQGIDPRYRDYRGSLQRVPMYSIMSYVKCPQILP